MIELLGTTKYCGKDITAKDSVGLMLPFATMAAKHGLKDDWYGGNGKKFSFIPVDKGVYLIVDGRMVPQNIAIEQGIEVLADKVTDIEALDRKGLIELAKKCGISGKIATMSTDELINKIKEVMDGEEEGQQKK